MDLKVFDLKNYEIGITAPPFHVNCRSVTIPYFDDEEEGERAARDPETRKTVYVSDKMTYKEWKQKFLVEKVFEWKTKAVSKIVQDVGQFEIYKKIIGEKNLPENIDKFQELKYSNIERWESLKSYKRSIQIGELTPLIDFETYEKIKKEIQHRLVGIVLPDETEIKSFSNHFIARILGSIEQKRNGVLIKDVKEALLIPVEKPKLKIDKRTEGISMLYEGKNLQVSINPDIGNLIQINLKTKKGGKNARAKNRK